MKLSHLLAVASFCVLNIFSYMPVASAAEPINETPIEKPKTTEERAEDLDRAFYKGNFEQVLTDGIPLLDEYDDILEPYRSTANYVVGFAAFRRGWFHKAEQHLSEVRLNPPLYSPSAPELLERTKKMRAAMPPHAFDVKVQNKTLFQVYADKGDEWAEGLLTALPKAAELNQRLMGYSVEWVPVIVFSRPEQLEKYLTAGHGTTPYKIRTAAMAYNGVILFCHNMGESKRLNEVGTPSFLGTLTHEANHVAVSRIHHGRELPPWLLEGLACCAAAEIHPQLKEELVNRFWKAARTFTLQHPDQLEEYDKFLDMMLGHAQDLEGHDTIDTYAQGFNMVHFLISRLEGKSIGDFIRDVQKHDFEESVKKNVGCSKKEFYADYINWVKENARE